MEYFIFTRTCFSNQTIYNNTSTFHKKSTWNHWYLTYYLRVIFLLSICCYYSLLLILLLILLLCKVILMKCQKSVYIYIFLILHEQYTKVQTTSSSRSLLADNQNQYHLSKNRLKYTKKQKENNNMYIVSKKGKCAGKK